MMKWIGILALIAVVLLAVGGIGIADTAVPYPKNIVWNDIVPDEGETFPDGTLQHFVIDMHRSDAPDTWWNIVETALDAPDGVAQLREYGLERNGLGYEFRTVPYVHWPNGVIEELEVCYSGWAKAPAAHNGGCYWENL